MERAMSVEERIKRAEDIYNRRNGGYSKVISKDGIKEKDRKIKMGNVKKLLMQMFVALCIYVIFYAVTNRNHVFSEDFRKEVNSFFTEKTKISEWYSSIVGFVENKFQESEKKDLGNKESNSISDEENNGNEEQKNSIEETKVEKNIVEENIGGASENEKVKEDKKENLSEYELMVKNAKEIKEKISFIVPIKGRISSTFGWRNPTTKTVPKYHTGVDIAAAEGTVIKSATDGKVIMVSSKGDYGNHYQIEINDVVIVYAHCKKLYLKEGDIVKQGQEIAEVGSTGNSTGPHLHFEIRKGDTKIDPQLILDL